MWNRHAQKNEPSEIDTPNVWARIRDQNKLRELERNAPREPQIISKPREWLVMLGGAVLLAGFYTGTIANGALAILAG